MRLESESTENVSEIKSMVLENLKLTRELSGSVKKIRRYMFWQQVSGWIKFFLVAIPLVLAAIYLMPLIGKLKNTYTDLLGANGETGGWQDLLKSQAAQELLKKK